MAVGGIWIYLVSDRYVDSQGSTSLWSFSTDWNYVFGFIISSAHLCDKVLSGSFSVRHSDCYVQCANLSSTKVMQIGLTVF